MMPDSTPILPFRKKKENANNVSNNQVTGSGNDGGDGMNDDLERRVSCLESDVTEIKNNLITLTTRSESFATKFDVLEIREGLRLEMAESRQSLKSEMADLRQSLKVEMAEHRTELQKSFANQTWLLTGIVLSAMAVLVAVVTVIK
ncbi:hypothetical protein Q5442_04635 [Escherichia coli]|uniref:hypothetical protein n=1 Tax=Escherichia coli TaxID=562 RepID=UPI000E2DD2C3|nr:hypothetical protein [Escherichia coli]MED8008462.1 hypothetical protein [Escherichia coli]MED8031563.1 hypothetical protein [Escherichia coli]MED8038557.1 hypothetical protein [Escherichia coli]MED8043387.1 hypothetical protein [Escherichia coli]MED8047004.1 hypothetical protein [Escherichia coli]